MNATIPDAAPSSAEARGYRNALLFLVSCMALATAGAAFSIRNAVAGELGAILARTDPAHAQQLLGSALGMAFLGFAFTIPIGSSLLDAIGMRRLLVLSAGCFVLGTIGIICVPAGPGAHTWLATACLVTGLGWGLVETVINPLAAALYPGAKTHKLNVLHAWWPAGIAVGGLIAFALARLGVGWSVQYALVLLPAAAFGGLALALRFPPTERAAAQVSAATMFGEVRRPLFLLWFACMFLTAASELAPGQMVDAVLRERLGQALFGSDSAGGGVLVLCYISALMFVMRHFAGPIAHRVSPIGLMCLSSLLAAVGLFTLASASTLIGVAVAATLWGAGVCFMWPTMLAVVNERFPRGGALLMGLIGAAGTLSIWFFLPRMGAIYDTVKQAAAAGADAGSRPALMARAIGEGVASMFGAQPAPVPAAWSTAYAGLAEAARAGGDGAARLAQVHETAGTAAFQAMAVLPLAVMVVFAALWIGFRLRGGYRPVGIGEAT